MIHSIQSYFPSMLSIFKLGSQFLFIFIFHTLAFIHSFHRFINFLLWYSTKFLKDMKKVFQNHFILKLNYNSLTLNRNASGQTAPVGIYMFKVNNRNTRTRCEICSKLTIKTPGRCHWRWFGVFIVSFEHISLWTYNTIANF